MKILGTVALGTSDELAVTSLARVPPSPRNPPKTGMVGLLDMLSEPVAILSPAQARELAALLLKAAAELDP